MLTLHAYILRELLKMFGLTVLAVTALFTMGGGIFNIMTQEGISAGDVMRFLPMLIPIVVTLTMPMAALFAATIVYGRLAADNEFVACRSAGINIHRLFLPAILLSVFVTLFTLASANFVIPGFMQRITKLVRTNLGEIAASRLKTDGSVRYKHGDTQYILTAERAGIASDDQIRERNEQLASDNQFELAAGVTYLVVSAPTVLQIEGDEIVRFTSAARGLCKFDTRGDSVKVTLVIVDVRDVDLANGWTTKIKKQTIGPITVPIPLPNKPSWADLPTLLKWERQPWLYDGSKVGGQIDKFIAAVTPIRFSEYCSRRLSEGDGELILHDGEGGTYRIRAQEHVVRLDGRLGLEQVEVVHTKRGLDKPIRYSAERGEIIARPLGKGEAAIEVRLIGDAAAPVLEFNPRAEDYNKAIPKQTVSLDNALLPQEVKDEVALITRRAVVDPSVDLGLNEEMLDKRIGLQRATAAFRRKVAALIHFRLGFSSSVLVTVLMGAALGVIFRGARTLAAFGLACVPFAIVGIMMLMGRQLGEHAGTEAVGVAIIWGGLLMIAAADGLILRIGVRR